MSKLRKNLLGILTEAKKKGLVTLKASSDIAKLRKKPKIFELGSTNVYKDLGFKNAEEMQAKAVLASRIIDIIEKEKWTQQEAAEKLALKQPKISLLYRGLLSGFSLGELIALLNI